MRRPVHEGDWPEPSSPVAPPKANLSYARTIGGVVQDGACCETFKEPWQMGVFLNTLIKDCNEFIIHPDEGYIARYTVTTPDGRLQEFKVWSNFIDLRTAMSLGEKHDVPLPFHISNLLRTLSGKSPQSYAAYAEADAPPSTRAAEPPKPARAPSTPRASRGGLITLGQLCEGTKYEPSDVRAALRKRKIEKPASGWAFEEGDPLIAIVKEIVGS